MPPRLENSLDSRWAGVSREFFVSLRLGGTEIIIKRIIDVYVVIVNALENLCKYRFSSRALGARPHRQVQKRYDLRGYTSF